MLNVSVVLSTSLQQHMLHPMFQVKCPAVLLIVHHKIFYTSMENYLYTMLLSPSSCLTHLVSHTHTQKKNKKHHFANKD